MNIIKRKQNINSKTKYAVEFINVGKKIINKQDNIENHIFRNLSFNIKSGKITAILGSSGAGKTTTARIINGLEDYNSGKVFINGKLLTKKTQTSIRKKTAFIFQNFNLFPNMSVLENIVYSPIYVWKQDKQQTIQHAKAMLRTFNLLQKANNYPHELSGGQKQRVAIIRALILNPEILIMDEPTASLDPESTHDVIKIIRAINALGITIIIITHDIIVAKKATDNIIMLHGGRCVDNMLTKDFFEKTQKKSFYAQRFLSNCE